MFYLLYREWLLWRAQRRIERDDLYSATQILRRAASYSPDNPRVWVMLSSVYSRRGEFENAEQSLKKALELAPQKPSFHLLLGQIYYDTERFERARKEFEYCISAQPENQLAQNFLALTLYQLGEHSQAMEMFASTGLANNKEFLSRFSLLFEKEVMENPDKFPEPSPQYEEIVSSVYYRLYDTFRGSGVVGRVFKFLLLRKCFHRATRLMTYGSFSEALNVFNFILKIHPGNSDALSGIAISYYEQGKYEEAKKIFLELIEQEHFEPILLVYLGLCYYRLKNYNSALALFERVSNHRPEDYNANYYTGLCYLALGDKLNAVRSFEKAFKRYFVDTSEQCLDKLLRRIQLSSD